MQLEQISLARQLDMVFRALEEELASVTGGTVFVHIRNNTVGKFGIKHNPIDHSDGMNRQFVSGLSPEQRRDFRQMAVHSLKFKNGWTHGEVHFDFMLKQNTLVASVQMESNYNMASLVSEGLAAGLRQR